jgi:DUF2971 family protein
MEIYEEHNTLFHYTTIAGLKGIIESQTLHATHYKFLNDSTEIISLAPKIEDLVAPAVREAFERLAQNPANRAKMDARGGIDAIVAHDIKAVVRALYEVTYEKRTPFRHSEPYILSFCGHVEPYEMENGLLSQWRAYGRETGYAIAFDTKRLCDALRADNAAHFYSACDLGTVVYEDDAEKFESEFSKLISGFREMAPKIFGDPSASLGRLFKPFLSSAPRYKHRGFSEEQEVRAVVSPMGSAFVEHMRATDPTFGERNAGKTVKPRYAKANLASYIVLFETAKQTLPITKIIVGPHRDKEKRREELQRYLELSDAEIDVFCSKTPLI